MGKFTKFTTGIFLGTAASLAAMLFLAPESANDVRSRLLARINDLQEEARRAAEAQRRALEAELARLRGDLNDQQP